MKLQCTCSDDTEVAYVNECCPAHSKMSMKATIKRPWKWATENYLTNPLKPIGLAIFGTENEFVCSLKLGQEDKATLIVNAVNAYKEAK